MSLRRIALRIGAVAVPALLLAASVGGYLFLAQGGMAPLRVPAGGRDAAPADAATLARGEYLARIGNCGSCHTARGGIPFAGGRAFDTPWGTIHSSNLTPDPATGLGDWSREEFRHAMRHGVSRTGLLYPVFPFASFARLDDADLDALHAWLGTLPPVAAPTPANRLDFPASWRGALLGWRMLSHRPGSDDRDDALSPASRHGRYLVEGIGHCASCHGRYDALGAVAADGRLAGGDMPGQGWYAPPLDEAALARFDIGQLADYLRTGTSAHGAAYGPMAEAVYGGLRHLTPDDAVAMATYLKAVPAHPQATARPMSRRVLDGGELGAGLYATHCADCHGEDGRGDGRDHPPLRDAVAVRAPSPTNALRVVLHGAVPPATPGNPRPQTMPPFAQALSDDEIAAVVNHVRATWGTPARAVHAEDVGRARGIALD